MPRRKGAAEKVAAERRRAIATTPVLRTMQIPILARDREDAVRIARTKPWWAYVLNPNYPIHERDHWVFSVAGWSAP